MDPLAPQRKVRGDAAAELAPHDALLEKLLCVENLTYAQVAQRLEAEHGVRTTVKRLHRWYHRHEAEKLRDRTLRNITSSAEAVRQIRAQAEKQGVPRVEELMSLVRVLTMRVATSGAEVDVESITKLMHPVLEWARLQTKQTEVALAQEKFRTALKSKIEAGLDELAEAFKANPEAMDLYRQARDLIAKATTESEAAS